MPRRILVVAAAAAAVAAAAAASSSGGVLVVDLLSAPQPPPVVLAVQACAGLMNGNATRASPSAAYVLLHPEDAEWLALLEPSLPSPPPITPLDGFFATCLTGGPAAGRIRYDFTAQQALVPLVVTAAGALAGVPLEDGSPYLPPGGGLPVVFDALATWAGLPPANATADAYARFGNATTGPAKMNPGYNWTASLLDPPLDGSPDLSLADYIVSARLFNFYLPNGCVPGTADHAVVEGMAAGAGAPPGTPGGNPWPRPTPVLGYDDSWPLFGGDVYEAETTCVDTHSWGQVATSGVSNLAFYARAAPVTEPLAQPARPPVAYNASRTYVALVVGDGDNIAYIKSTRFDWFKARAAACAGGGGSGGSNPACAFPLAWSISPHLLTFAPGILRWYYATAGGTGRDYFTLPPSGHLYAYPGLMGPADQAGFVAATEAEAALLNTSATVEWEPVGTWAGAIAGYVPRYSGRSIVRSLFAVNVPYMIPIIDFGADEFWLATNGTVLFRPCEWRGTTGGALLPPFMLNATAMAAYVSTFPPGTVTHIYLTSDGGAQWTDFADMVAQLEPHVTIVTPDDVAPLALAAAAAGAGGGRVLA